MYDELIMIIVYTIMDPIPLPPLKRALDIVTSSIGIILLAPIVLILIVLILIEQVLIPSSRGPILYRETRISQGKPFMLWKIRTFKVAALAAAGANDAVIHTKKLERNKENLTVIGSLLRQIYMDEVPQLFSVLSGDMTFVGPRPTNQENYLRSMAKGHVAKRILKAGLTGRFQTHKHVKYNLNQEQVDMEYANFCRTGSGLSIVARDTFILLQTVVTVFRAEGL